MIYYELRIIVDIELLQYLLQILLCQANLATFSVSLNPMPSTFFTGSFISNSKDKSFFNLSITDLLLKAMNISFTYNSR